jgi:hypothetical protein
MAPGAMARWDDDCVDFSSQVPDSNKMATYRCSEAAGMTTCVEISYSGVYKEPVRRRLKEWIAFTGRRNRQHMF